MVRSRLLTDRGLVLKGGRGISVITCQFVMHISIKHSLASIEEVLRY